MFKKIKFVLFLGSAMGVTSAFLLGHDNPTRLSPLHSANIEALTAGFEIEAQGTFICEGNTGVCAKGKDENTGHDFIIHGTAKLIK